MKKGFIFLLLCLNLGCASTARTPATEANAWDTWTQLGLAENVEGTTIIKVKINQQEARMVVDEKSDTSAITPELKTRLKLGLLKIAEATLKNQKKVWLDVVKLENMEVGSRQFTLSPVIVLDVNQGQPNYGPIDGILGKDFIKSFNLNQAQNVPPNAGTEPANILW